MNICLRPAEEVPDLFAERLRTREAGQDISVVTMTVEFSDNPVIQAMVEYGQPDDTLAADYYGHFHGMSIVPRFITKNGHDGHDEAREHFQEDFPGSYIVMNEPPTGGWIEGTILDRSHIKAFALGSKILSLGGVNCVPYSFNETTDLMLDFESDEYSDFLSRFVANDGNLRSQGAGERLRLDDQNEVLVNYGARGESVILDSLISDLETDVTAVTISSSYLPYGKLDQALYRHLKRGSQVDFYANHPSKFQPPAHATAERFLMRYCALQAKTPYITPGSGKFNHLKAAVIKYPQGSEVAYIGSDNFHELAVRAGTAEVCLRTTDPELIEQLESYMAERLVSRENVSFS